jgi:cobyrinic acid a,c-diamide synthase
MTAGAMLVASTGSGTGKTTLTAGLLRAFRRRGLAVTAAKSGPDYIDPLFHRAASGRPTVNLDSWAMPPALLDGLVARAVADADLVVIEGAMGLFDGGAGEPGRTGAAADLAARYRVPVMLVLDVAGQSQTAAAVVRGLATHDGAVHVAGVVLNRVASERHRRLVGDAIVAIGIPVLGAIPRDPSIALPSRHLGLVQAGELADLEMRLDRFADMVESHVDLDRMLALASPLQLGPINAGVALPPPGQRIALAQDAAFTFMYEHVTAGWRQAGAEIVAFSPLADEPPPEDCDACWLPGGYPELHAGALAGAIRFREGLAQFAKTRPVHGECGGFMVLGAAIEDAHGHRHAMTGLLDHATSFAKRRLSLGYRVARLLASSPIGGPGDEIRGHEFHYSTVLEPGNDAPLVELFDGRSTRLGVAGARRGHVSGSYFHAVAAMQPG